MYDVLVADEIDAGSRVVTSGSRVAGERGGLGVRGAGDRGPVREVRPVVSAEDVATAREEQGAGNEIRREYLAGKGASAEGIVNDDVVLAYENIGHFTGDGEGLVLCEEYVFGLEGRFKIHVVGGDVRGGGGHEEVADGLLCRPRGFFTSACGVAGDL